jgi:hypothetical protein
MQLFYYLLLIAPIWIMWGETYLSPASCFNTFQISTIAKVSRAQ